MEESGYSVLEGRSWFREVEGLGAGGGRAQGATLKHVVWEEHGVVQNQQ